MTTLPMAETARLIAKLLANRPTPQEDIPALIEGVHAAVAGLRRPTPARAPAAAWSPEEPQYVDETQGGASAAEPTAVEPQRQRRRSPRPRPTPFEAPPAAEPAAPPPAPKLLRRADVVQAAPSAPVGLDPLAVPRNTVRGIVKWFDARERKGALRLPGFGGDIAVDAQLLADSGIARLYKGQEIEATINGTPEAPRLVKLTLPGGIAPALRSGGVVRGRHAKPVVVELKREGLRRVAARAEAEQVLGPNRAR
jgi:cold shock CspA family protein